MYNVRDWAKPAPKHVLMLSNQCCIRVQKQAHALRRQGWRVDSLSYCRPADTTGFDFAYVAKQGRTVQALRDNGASIIHVHNEPDWLMRIADQGCNGRPIVYDCHDLEQNRAGFVTDDEEYAFGRADGIISVSSAHRDVAYALHPWNVPEAVVMSLPLRKWQPTACGKRAGVVYQGGLMPPGRCSWRDLSVPCDEFAKAGIDFDIYANPGMAEHYPRVHRFLRYERLLSTLTNYSFGFCGHDPAHPVYETACPNKVFEYAMCGVIPLFVSLRHAAEVFGSGIVASDTRDAIRQMQALEANGEVETLRADVLAHARFMDDEIQNTIALYEELLP